MISWKSKIRWRDYAAFERLEGHIWQRFQPKFETFTLREITAHSAHLRERAKNESLDELLPEAYALACRAAQLVIRETPRKNQISAAIAIHGGAIVEMENGEGKTLTIVISAYLNSLQGNGVHVATYNDYLARRDALWMGPVYVALGVTVGLALRSDAFVLGPSPQNFLPGSIDAVTSSTSALNQSDFALREPSASLEPLHQGAKPTPAIFEADGRATHQLLPASKREAYECDVVYAKHATFVMDYLQDNVAISADTLTQRALQFIILDEADSALVDLARTPCSLTQVSRSEPKFFETLTELARCLEEGLDFHLGPLRLTPEGIARSEAYLHNYGYLGDQGLYSVENAGVAHQLFQSINALHNYFLGIDYGVKSGQIIPISSYTGRYQYNNVFSDGLQQALQAKERLPIAPEQESHATISFQHFFKLYQKMSGVTATAVERAEEFREVYDLDVIQVPSHKKAVRDDRDDLIYKTKKEKFPAIMAEIKEIHRSGRPVLVGTQSTAEAEQLGHLLTEAGLPFEILHADTEEAEARIIAGAGARGAITISAKIAGRGTDILIDEEVAGIGGLFVIGTERNESRHIDRQIAGRAGRQGRPGGSRFYVSFEDDLMRNFGAAERMTRIMERFGLKEGQELEHPWLNKSVHQAQRRFENRNYEQRRRAYDMDGILDRHRRRIYAIRQKALRGEDLDSEIDVMGVNTIRRSIERFMPASRRRKYWDIAGFDHFWCDLCPDLNKGSFVGRSRKQIHGWLREKVKLLREDAREGFDLTMAADAERRYLIELIDKAWQRHLRQLEQYSDELELYTHTESDLLTLYALKSNQAFLDFIERVEAQLLSRVFRLSDTLEFDDVISKQREVLYGYRNEVTETDDPRSMVYKVVDEVVPIKVAQHLKPVEGETLDYPGLIQWINNTFPLGLTLENSRYEEMPREQISQSLIERIKHTYEMKCSYEEGEAVKAIERYVILNAIDRLWQEHLHEMDSLREGVYLRAYGRKSPPVEYKTKASEMFDELMGSIHAEVLDNLFRSTSNLQAFEKFLANLPEMTS